MNKKENNTEMLDFEGQDLTGEDIFKITQELVKEFIETKQNLMTDDRKLNAIGKALIEQKKVLENIFSIQSNHGKELSDNLGDIFEKQENISREVAGITNVMGNLQDAKATQEKHLKELSHFQEIHNDLVELSKEQSNQSIDRLENINQQVSELFEQIDSVDIEDKVADISKRTIEIDDLLKLHGERQDQAREDASKNMLDLLAEVTSFRRQLSNEGMVGQLVEIQKSAEDNNHKVDELNEKFDIFVEVYELSKVEKEESLEDVFQNEEGDIFYVPEVEESLSTEVEEDLSAEIEDIIYGNSEEDTSDAVEKEDLDEESLEDIFDDEPEEDLSSYSVKNIQKNDTATNNITENDDEYIDEIPEYGRIEKESFSIKPEDNEKKQGFFGKLFGGR